MERDKARVSSHKEAHKSSLLENRHRRLRGDTFDFFETKACGNTLNYIQSLYGGFYDNIQSGIIANTCFQCSNQDLPSVASCFYYVSPSGVDISMTFMTYSDTECSTGGVLRGTTTYTPGKCMVEGYSVDFHSGITDVTSLFTAEKAQVGIGYIDYSDSSCTAPVAYKAMGVRLGRCYGDNLNMTLDACGDTVKMTAYSEPGCSGSTTIFESAVPTCDISGSGSEWSYRNYNVSGSMRNSGHAADQIVCFNVNETNPMNLLIIMALIVIAGLLALVVGCTLLWHRYCITKEVGVAPTAKDVILGKRLEEEQNLPEWMLNMSEKDRSKSLKVLQKFSIDPRDLNMGEDEKVFDKKNKEKEKEKEKKLEFSIEGRKPRQKINSVMPEEHKELSPNIVKNSEFCGIVPTRISGQ